MYFLTDLKKNDLFLCCVFTSKSEWTQSTLPTKNKDRMDWQQAQLHSKHCWKSTNLWLLLWLAVPPHKCLVVRVAGYKATAM